MDMGIVRAGRTDAVIVAAASGVERLRFDPQGGHLSGDVATTRSGLAPVTFAEVLKKMRIVRALDRAIRVVLVRAPEYVVGPAVPDCAHIWRSGVEECLLYGPGRFEYARRPDEQCRLDDVRLLRINEHLPSTRLVNAVNSPFRARADKERIPVDGERPNIRVLGIEEHRTLTMRSHAIHLSLGRSPHVDVVLRVNGQGGDIQLLRIEDERAFSLRG